METAQAQKSVRIIQITDAHLEPEFGGTLLGMNTDESLSHVLDTITDREPQFDLMLATGDLSTHGKRTAYQRFREYLTRFSQPKYWLPGNHDDSRIMQEVCADGDEMKGLVRIGAWQLILLDSTIYREVGGNVKESELQRLRDCVAERPDLHTAVFCHHPPLTVGCKWMDGQRINNGEAFLACMASLPSVKLFVCGHVHQHWTAQYEHLPLMSTPSTCVQFAPNSLEFKVDTIMPGYRWLELHADGTFETGVERIEYVDLCVDLESLGY